jgi:hypothetical protein
VKELLPFTAERLARAEDLLRNPPPRSRIEAAKKFGIDLTLISEQLRLTPAERVRRLEIAANELLSVRGVAVKGR